jgi:hypothetical protein
MLVVMSLLAGLPMPDRSKVITHTKRTPFSFRFGFGRGADKLLKLESKLFWKRLRSTKECNAMMMMMMMMIKIS